MERIQYAIAKARAQRDSQDQTVPPSPMPNPSPTGGGAAFQDASRPDTPQATRTQAQRRTEAADKDTANTADKLSVEKVWDALPTFQPKWRLAVRNRLVSLTGRTGAADVDGIRTRLLQHLRAKGMRRVAITSPGPSCGKSTLAINLGLSLGRQNDQRIIVADLDFRRPHMATILGINKPFNFGNVLEGLSPFSENAIRYGSHLAFASSHAPIRHPAELLQSKRTARVIEEIEATYDPTVMLFDLPPLLVNDDTMAFLGHVDCALIVAAAEKTTTKELDRCERDIASQTKVLGVVLNRCRYMTKSETYSEYKS